jgi:hypothetical protein
MRRAWGIWGRGGDLLQIESVMTVATEADEDEVEVDRNG